MLVLVFVSIFSSVSLVAGIQKIFLSSAPAQAESLKGLGNKSYKVWCVIRSVVLYCVGLCFVVLCCVVLRSVLFFSVVSKGVTWTVS